MSKISVIVPVYKVESFLCRCVDSILGQSFQEFELILIDDGSPDRCGDICDEYAAQDHRIHVIHQENGGLSAARNAGIDWVFANSDSQWLSFVDSDDWIHRDYLKVLFLGVQKYHAQIAACGFYRTDQIVKDNPINAENGICLDPDQAYTLHYGKCMSAWGKVYKKELFREIRFPVGKLHEDAFITHLLTFEAERICIFDLPLYYYYTNPGSITRVKWNPKRLQEIEAHELRLSYLEAAGRKAYKREMEAYGDVLMEQAEVLWTLCREEMSYKEHLKFLQKKLRWVLGQKKKVGQLNFDKGLLWVILMAYFPKPVWGVMCFVKRIRRKYRSLIAKHV